MDLFGKKNGIGELKLKDGSVYIGDYANDKRNGYGIMTYPDGKAKG